MNIVQGKVKKTAEEDIIMFKIEFKFGMNILSAIRSKFIYCRKMLLDADFF